MEILKTMAILLPLILFTSCGSGDFWDSVTLSSKKSEPVITQEVLSADGVKLISPFIDDSRDPRSLKQENYLLDQDHRLLIRIENFDQGRSKILSDEQYKVFFDIKLRGEKNSGTQLKLCPLNRNWMILATWFEAVPMPGGAWNEPGGDFNVNECIIGIAMDQYLAKTKVADNDQKKSPGIASHLIEQDRLVFDITQWVIAELKGSRRNLGWVLISTEGPQELAGDALVQDGPRVYWNQLAR
jgi:hypothetical protein